MHKPGSMEQKQKDSKFEVSLNYIADLVSTTATSKIEPHTHGAHTNTHKINKCNFVFF